MTFTTDELDNHFELCEFQIMSTLNYVDNSPKTDFDVSVFVLEQLYTLSWYDFQTYFFLHIQHMICNKPLTLMLMTDVGD